MTLVNEMIPKPSIVKVVLEKNSQDKYNEGRINYNPHISRADQISFYGETIPQATDTFRSSVRIEMGEFNQGNSVTHRKVSNFKDFLSENTNAYLVQVTDKNLARIIKDSFFQFYIIFHEISFPINKFTRRASRDIRLIKDGLNDGRIIVEAIPRAEFTSNSTANLFEGKTYQVRKMAVTKLFAPDKNLNFLSYFTYLDVNRNIIEGNLGYDMIMALIDGFVTVNDIVVVEDKEVKIDPKITDLTIFDAIRASYDIHMSDFEYAYSGLRDGVTPDLVNPEYKKKNMYFDEAYLSYGEDNSVGMFFGIDIMQMLKTESQFYRLLKNVTDKTMLQSILRLSRIKHLKVMRRRVSLINALNKLGVPYMAAISFNAGDFTPPLEIVASGKDNSVGILDSLESIKQIFINDGEDNSGVKYYSVRDNSALALTDGFYQYGVELKVEDGLRNELLSVYGRYVKSRVNFEKYYEDIFARGKFDFWSDKVDSVYAEELEKLPILPWVNMIDSLKEVLYLLSGEETVFKIDIIKMWISPSYLNSKSLDLFRELIEMIEAKLINVVSIPASPKGYNEGGFSGGFGRDRLIGITHWFSNQVVDSNYRASGGVIYIDIPEEEGLGEVSVDDFAESFLERFEDAGKFFKEETNSSTIVPKQINFGIRVIKVDENIPVVDIFGTNLGSNLSGGRTSPQWGGEK